MNQVGEKYVLQGTGVCKTSFGHDPQIIGT